MRHEADALAAHVLRLPLADSVRVPFGELIDATPGGLLLGGDEIRRVLWRADQLAPVAELETGDQVGLNGAACAARAGRDAEIMINDPSDGPKADTAALKKSQNIRRVIDKGDHALLVEFTAAKKGHVGDNVLVRIVFTRVAHEMIVPDPDQAIGIGRRSTELVRLLDQQRGKSRLMCSKRCRQAGDTRAEDNNVVRVNGMTKILAQADTMS